MSEQQHHTLQRAEVCTDAVEQFNMQYPSSRIKSFVSRDHNQVVFVSIDYVGILAF